MTKFFFYNKLTNIDVIKKISNNFDINDGYIIIKNYDIENNLLEISDESKNNNQILYGKIVNFYMKLEDILKKINELEECKLENRTKYTLEKIFANKSGGGIHSTYIIY